MNCTAPCDDAFGGVKGSKRAEKSLPELLFFTTIHLIYNDDVNTFYFCLRDCYHYCYAVASSEAKDFFVSVFNPYLLTK